MQTCLFWRGLLMSIRRLVNDVWWSVCWEREEKRVTKPWLSPVMRVSPREEREQRGRLQMRRGKEEDLRCWYWWTEWPVIWLNQVTSPRLFVMTKWLSVTTHLDSTCCPWISISWTPENRSWQVIVLESTLTIRLSYRPSDGEVAIQTQR